MLELDEVRSLYSDADTVHDFGHVLRVCTLAERIAKFERAEVEIVRAASLLHDLQHSSVGGQRSKHHLVSAELAGQILQVEGWSSEDVESVQHCIRAHSFRGTERPVTIEAICLFDADKLDVLGAIGVARTVSYAALAGEPFYAEPSDKFIRSGELELGEPHSAYHEFLIKLRKITDCLHTSTAKSVAKGRYDRTVEFFESLRSEINAES